MTTLFVKLEDRHVHDCPKYVEAEKDGGYWNVDSRGRNTANTSLGTSIRTSADHNCSVV